MTPKAMSRSWFLFCFLAIILQALGITTFILAARTDWRWVGKPTALMATLALDIGLLAWIFTESAKVQSVFVASACLSAAYVAAFYLVGALAFGGLLRDFGPHSADYLFSILRVSAVALLLFTICSVVVFAAMTVSRRGSKGNRMRLRR